jgi:hypothetical protein
MDYIEKKKQIKELQNNGERERIIQELKIRNLWEI